MLQVGRFSLWNSISTVALPGQPSSGESSRYSLLQSFPELSSQLTEARASGDEDFAYHWPPRTYRTVSATFESLGVIISIQSSVKVFASDRLASVNGDIRVDNKTPGPISVNASGLLALQKAGFRNEGSVQYL